MGGMTKNYGNIKTLVADVITGTSITNSGSTSTTSITFVIGLGLFDATSTTINYTKQTMYISGGVVQNFSTITSTSIKST